MRALRVVIADDEPLARDALRDALRGLPEVEIVAECADGVEVIEAVEREHPDAIFLDISMPRMDGLTAAESLLADRGPAIVFVTAYEEHAVRAFDLGADDYLLKPHDESRVAAAVARVRRRPAPRSPRFLAMSGQRLVVVRGADIEYVSAADNYVEIFARGGGRALLRRTLTAFERELDRRAFARVHRSHVVRVEAIAAIEPLPSGDATVVLRGGARLPMSRTYRAGVVGRVGR